MVNCHLNGKLLVGFAVHDISADAERNDGAREEQHRDAHIRGAGHPPGIQSADGGSRIAGMREAP